MLASGPGGRGSSGRIPTARLPDLRPEGPAEGVRDEPGSGQDAVEGHSGLPAGSVQEVDEVLRGEIPGSAGRVGAAAGATRRRVEAADAGIEAGRDVGEGSTTRVVEVVGDPVQRDTRGNGGTSDGCDLRRDSDPDRVSETDLIDAEFEEAQRDFHRPRRVDA